MRRRLLECVHADSSPRPPVSGEPRAPHSHRSRRPARLADWANYNVDPKFDTKQGVQIASGVPLMLDERTQTQHEYELRQERESEERGLPFRLEAREWALLAIL